MMPTETLIICNDSDFSDSHTILTAVFEVNKLIIHYSNFLKFIACFAYCEHVAYIVISVVACPKVAIRRLNLSKLSVTDSYLQV